MRLITPCIFRTLFLFNTVLLLSCAGGIGSNNGLTTRLADRGPVALSADNPYLVGNLVLAREVNRSVVLKGFLSHRGTPPAIEVNRPTFGSHQLLLYYPEDREQFAFEQVGREWIIDGPQQIEYDKLKDLALITKSTNTTSAKLLSGHDLRVAIGEESEEDEAQQQSNEISAEPHGDQSSSAHANFSDLHSSTPSSARQNEKGADSKGFVSPAVVERPSAQSLDDLSEEKLAAIIKSKSNHPAEITSKGDLVHYVTFGGETLSIIARWYTYDRNNAGRIARINGIKDPNTVSVGDIIVIPSYLVRNKSRMTEGGLQTLKSLTAEKLK